MIGPVAVLDANVLYPATLRDLLLQLAFDGLFQARWSSDIEAEWTLALLAERPDLTRRIERTKALMRRAVPGALVRGYAAQINDLLLPDPDDRHVMAAAVAASADCIVTFNIKDFPPSALAAHGLIAQHPDAFLLSFAAGAPRRLRESVQRCLSRLEKPPMSFSDYLAVIRRLNLIKTARFLEANPPG